MANFYEISYQLKRLQEQLQGLQILLLKYFNNTDLETLVEINEIFSENIEEIFSETAEIDEGDDKTKQEINSIKVTVVDYQKTFRDIVTLLLDKEDLVEEISEARKNIIVQTANLAKEIRIKHPQIKQPKSLKPLMRLLFKQIF